MKDLRRKIDTDLDTIMPILLGCWRRLHKLAGPKDVLQTREFRDVIARIEELNTMSKDGVSLIGTNYLENPDLLGAHILYHWVIHYQQGLSLLGELPKVPNRVLDVCSGAAPFAFAALRHGASDVVATDQSLLAMKLGAEICGRYGLTLSFNKWSCLKQNQPVEGKFDLIMVSHCLEELFPGTKKGWQEDQKLFLDRLFSHLNPDGHLLLVEGSYPESNRRLLTLRDQFVQLGFPVQAPCIWQGECPALKTANSPCYAQREFEKPRLIKEIQRASSINLSSLKMSYVIFRTKEAGWDVVKDKKLYRVISPPVESYSGKRFYLCGTDGKKQLGTRLQSHPKESRPFEYLRRGELISFTNALESQNAIDIIEGTEVHVEAACGKPLPTQDNTF